MINVYKCNAISYKMFAISAKRLLYASNNVLIRSFITGTKLEYPRRNSRNPGIDNRLSAFQQDGIKVREDNVEEYIDESDSSFYNVEDAYDEHLNETLMGKHDLRRHIVKEKYFKDNMPNLLTWSEKEQIRHLATTQPQEWTPQKLAESFPVTENVVKKLLKYPWQPASEQRIARHDASAMRNWRELKEGTLDVSETLREHFLKFSERTLPPLNRKSIKIDISQERMGEFEEIIKRENDKEKVESNDINDDNEESNTSNNEKPYIKKDYKRVTLDELANKIKSRLHHGQNVEVPDRIIVDSLITCEKSDDTQINSKDIELVSSKIKDNQLTQFKENDKDIVIGVNYPERIRIPKKAFKRGATYKINDCFYDYDGKFLYRVIGMSNSQE